MVTRKLYLVKLIFVTIHVQYGHKSISFIVIFMKKCD